MDQQTHVLGLLAIGIGEWCAAIEHMDAVEQAGHPVSTMLRRMVEDDLGRLCLNWAAASGRGHYQHSADRAWAITDARRWATENLSEINELTNRKEVN